MRKSCVRKEKDLKEVAQSVSTNILKSIGDVNRNQRQKDYAENLRRSVSRPKLNKTVHQRKKSPKCDLKQDKTVIHNKTQDKSIAGRKSEMSARRGEVSQRRTLAKVCS